MLEQMRHLCESILSAAQAQACFQDVIAQTVVRRGSVGKTFAGFYHRWSADYLALGSSYDAQAEKYDDR